MSPLTVVEVGGIVMGGGGWGERWSFQLPELTGWNLRSQQAFIPLPSSVSISKCIKKSSNSTA